MARDMGAHQVTEADSLWGGSGPTNAKNQAHSFVGFPCVLKVSSERFSLLNYRLPPLSRSRGSFATFHKPKWRKAKKQLLLSSMEKFLSVSRSQIHCRHIVFILLIMIKALNYVQFYTERHTLTSSLRPFWFPRTHLANGPQTQWRQSTAAPRHSEGCEAGCRDAQCGSRKELGQLPLWRPLQNRRGRSLNFSPFFVKVKVLFGVLSVSGNEYRCRASVKWSGGKRTLSKRGTHTSI